MTARSFTHLHELPPGALERLVESALEVKREPPGDRPLAGQSVALCFMNPSLRTQVSFSVAAAQLGAHPVILAPGRDSWSLEFEDGAVMDGPASEHAKEAVRVLSRYCQALALRCFPEGKSWAEDRREKPLAAFRKYSTVPVINMESAMGHPCQALADLVTIRERMDPRGKDFVLAWAPHVKALPVAVPQSAAEMAALAGMNVTILRPEGCDLDDSVMRRLSRECAERGTRLRVTDDREGAFAGANVVYAKAWGSLKDYGAPPPQDPAFRARWTVAERDMRLTDDALFMHCLPVRRNLVATDGVLDGPGSVIIDQAENRLHAAKALLLWLLAPEACHA